MFCHHCIFSYNKGLITVTKVIEDAFIINEFNNWKKARERFSHHQPVECHNEVQIKLTYLHTYFIY